MEIVKKYGLSLMLIMVILGVCLFYADQKSGMFIDEIYSYGLSNSEYAPFVTNLKGGDLTGQILTHEDMHNYLTVQAGEQFHYGSVYYNQTQDVHPPLYYWLLHTYCSIVVEGASKWIGLTLNFILFALTLWVLYRLVLRLFENQKLALMALALYGLSTIAISTVLMIRMYMLLTFLTVLLAYWIIYLLREPERTVTYVWIFLTVFAGMMTQYYFVFYAFFVCVAFDVYALIQKRYKMMIRFSCAAILGVAVMVLVYPACIDHLLADKQVSGRSVIQTIQDVGAYQSKLHNYLYQLNYYSRVISRTGKILCVLLLIGGYWIIKAPKQGRTGMDAMVILLPAVFAYGIIVISSPMLPLRYIYNLIPVLVCSICFLTHLVLRALPDKLWASWLQTTVVVAVMALSFVTAIRVTPEFLYPEHEEYTKLAQQYSEFPCVYFEKNRVAPITQDLLQLSEFQDVFVASDTESHALVPYLSTHQNGDQVVVYVDTTEDLLYFSGLDADALLTEFQSSFGYSECEQLYTFNGTMVFLLSN